MTRRAVCPASAYRGGCDQEAKDFTIASNTNRNRNGSSTTLRSPSARRRPIHHSHTDRSQTPTPARRSLQPPGKRPSASTRSASPTCRHRRPAAHSVFARAEPGPGQWARLPRHKRDSWAAPLRPHCPQASVMAGMDAAAQPGRGARSARPVSGREAGCPYFSPTTAAERAEGRGASVSVSLRARL